MTTEQSEFQHTRHTLLIVEDSPTTLNTLGEALRSEYTIMVAANGENGLELLARDDINPPDLILLDIMMPGIDGYEVYRRLQAAPKTQGIPVIFVTALSSSENESEGLALGAVDYISKPFNNDIVRARVATHLKLKWQRDQLLSRQQELIRLNQRNHIILETAAEGIYGIDKNGLISFMNPAALKMIGRCEAEVLGENSCAILHHHKANGNKHQESECMVILAMSQGVIKENSQEVYWRKDVSSFPVEFVAAPAFEDGEIIGAVVVFKDISRRKMIEAELLKGDKMKAFEVVAGGIAHDFNNLLTAIIGNLEMAMTYAKSHEKLSRFLNNSYNSSMQAKELVAKIHTISRSDVELREEINLYKNIRQVVKSMEQQTGIDFKINITDHIWPVHASQIQIVQLLKNILLNSQEAMVNGGTILITAINCPDGQKEYASLSTGPYLKISVQDQGEGIPAENYPKIFDPYFSTKQRCAKKGMGLGLTVCHSIIDKHKGHLEIQSLPGEGTTVQIYLPAITAKTMSVPYEN